MFFDKNCQALAATHPGHSSVIEELQNIAPTQEAEVLSCPDGAYTMHYKGMCIHDPEGPLAEVTQTIQKNATCASDRLHAVLGLGLGYLPDELVQKSPGHIAIYEPDLPLLRFVLDNVDLSEVFSLNRVALFTQQADFLAYIRQKLYSQYQLDVLALKGCAFLLADQVMGLMEQLTRIELFRIQDFKTGEHFHVQWIQQFFQNYSHFHAMPTLDIVNQAFCGKPAVVISRGPSLDAALPALKALSNSIVMIAVGGALHHLHRSDIVPDFALFYDANGMQEQLHGLPESYLSQITFVLSPFTQSSTFDCPSRGKLLMLAQNNLHFADFLDQALQTKHQRLAGGGTVSIVGFQMAQLMGCNPIILAGQDLAFPNNQVYAGGVQMRLNDKGQLDLEASSTLYTAPYNLDKVPGQQGEPLFTTLAYKSFLIHLEEMAAEIHSKPNPITLWNASVGGAKIEGFPVRSLESFIGEFADWKPSFALLEAPVFSEAERTERKNALLQSVQHLSEELKAHLIFLKNSLLVCSRSQHNLKKLAQLMLEQNRSFYARFQDYPFAAYVLIHPIRHFKERFQQTLSLPDGPIQAQKEMIGFLNTCIDLLEKQVLPVVQEIASSAGQENKPIISVTTVG